MKKILFTLLLSLGINGVSLGSYNTNTFKAVPNTSGLAKYHDYQGIPTSHLATLPSIALGSFYHVGVYPHIGIGPAMVASSYSLKSINGVASGSLNTGNTGYTHDFVIGGSHYRAHGEGGIGFGRVVLIRYKQDPPKPTLSPIKGKLTLPDYVSSGKIHTRNISLKANFNTPGSEGTITY